MGCAFEICDPLVTIPAPAEWLASSAALVRGRPKPSFAVRCHLDTDCDTENRLQMTFFTLHSTLLRDLRQHGHLRPEIRA